MRANATKTTATSENIEESPLDRLSTYFRVATEVTGDELREALRIRHQVYCIENPFENPGDHPDGFEQDEFDSHSLHSLLIPPRKRAGHGHDAPDHADST